MISTPVGVIGGSGLYQMQALQEKQELTLNTPFGIPSDALVAGTIDGVRVVFLARHGRHHTLLPHEIPYRANIHAFKQLGVRYLISVSAVGSLKEKISPCDMVLPDQFIDRTQRREQSFFGSGIVAHIAFAKPVCPVLSNVLAQAAVLAAPEVRTHRGGSYLCIDGPAFSTEAESQLYRAWGASVIGMTNLPEAKLAREAEMAYATLALVTDYDCWHPKHESVTVEMAIANLQQNAAIAQQVIRRAVALIAADPPVSSAHDALRSALVTPLAQADPVVKARLAVLLAKYLP